MATELAYLQDFGVETCNAKVAALHKTEDERDDVVLDRTCFYPRGGGQDWDTGRITTGDKIFTVQEVRLDEDGRVHHLGTFAGAAFKEGEEVQGKVDAARRAVNTRLHSAGHLIDLAVARLNLPWTPIRGAHYPHMSFVEYESKSEWDPGQAESLKKQIEAIIAQAVAENSENKIRFMPVDQMHTVCRHVPENIPRNKPARVVIYCGDFGVPCGGTHVRALGEVGVVHISKIKKKEGHLRVSYTVVGIN